MKDKEPGLEDKQESRPKPKKDNGSDQEMGAGLSIGLALGVAYGVLFHNLALGISIGLCLGLAFDWNRKKKKM